MNILPKYVTLILLFIVLVAVARWAWAQDENAILACVGKDGTLRIVSNWNQCKNTETPIRWNIAGVPGPKGDKGDPGPPGTTNWNRLASVPYGFEDGIDNDMLGTISCTPNELIKFDGSSWVCADESDHSHAVLRQEVANLNAQVNLLQATPGPDDVALIDKYPSLPEKVAKLENDIKDLFDKFDDLELPPIDFDRPEEAALMALYDSTSGDNWLQNVGWPSHCNWYGVTCNAAGRAQALDLNNNGLNGPIPPELDNLRRLVRLGLGNNELSGPIPSELSNLSSLETLNLYDNKLSGPIPSELGNLSNLKILFLMDNELDGSIPSELGDLSELQALWLTNNELSGPIPSELGGLSKLQDLDLNGNELSGPIPSELGNLRNLESLSLGANELSDPIPSELGNLSNLKILSLGNNKLSGPIPSELGNLRNLIILDLGNNKLSGPIPSELVNLSDLMLLGLDGNDPSLCVSTPELLEFLNGLDTSYLGPRNLCQP